MREWNNFYNPFNSAKVLLLREHLEAIVEGEFLPPVTVDTDPTNQCNLNCIWCNAWDYIHENKSGMLPEEHLIKLADFYKEWGVKSTCVAGGGEPLLNPGFNNFIWRLAENGIESGPITNGVLLDKSIEAISQCSTWCGISVDAAKNETYMKIKRTKNKKLFNRVIKNIETLTLAIAYNNTKCKVAYKYLLHPYNALEIYEAAKLAKSIGVNHFHLRPVGWDNISITKNLDDISFLDLMKEINIQIEGAMELEDDNFQFFGIRHKFSGDLKRKVNFEKCRATPLLATFGADGRCHLCFDMRGNEDLILCNHYPDPREILKVWGSQKHKDLIDSINPHECPRCTFGPYNEAIEQAIIKDNMNRNFP